MKKARIITLILCIAAAAVFSGFFNIMGGIAILIQDYTQSAVGDYSLCGKALLASSAFLIAAVVLAAFEKVWLPAVFNVIGSAFYIYTVKVFYSIPNELIAKEYTEPFAERHLLTVIVTVLLAALTFFNVFTEKNSAKREKKRAEKYEKENRDLKNNEKIL